MPELVPAYPIRDVTPAEYNPRHLSDDAFARLRESLKKYGVVKPVILNRDGTIVAGHQRTKALTANGAETVPAIVLDTHASRNDEVVFNLVHNSVETCLSRVALTPRQSIRGYEWIDWDEIDVVEMGSGPLVAATADLVARHGEWGSVIANPETGDVVANADYAAIVARQRLPLLVYWCDPSDANELGEVMAADFGVYDASKVVKESWQQWVIQPFRRKSDKEWERDSTSTLYEEQVIPTHKTDDRVVDLGAGRLFYPKRLTADGWNILPYEPFVSRDGGPGKGRVFDMGVIIGMIRSLARDVAKNGLFDVVVSDSVVNAAINDDYHRWIMLMNWAMCADHGRLLISTRSFAGAESANSKGRALTGSVGSLQFVSPEMQSVTVKLGQWSTIRFHTPETLAEFVGDFFEDVTVIPRGTGNLHAIAAGPKQMDRSEVQRALEEEFNMPYPGGLRHGQHESLVAAVMRRLDEKGRFFPGVKSTSNRGLG